MAKKNLLIMGIGLLAVVGLGVFMSINSSNLSPKADENSNGEIPKRTIATVAGVVKIKNTNGTITPGAGIFVSLDGVGVETLKDGSFALTTTSFGGAVRFYKVGKKATEHYRWVDHNESVVYLSPGETQYYDEIIIEKVN